MISRSTIEGRIKDEYSTLVESIRKTEEREKNMH